jgi:hypothetical protein
MDLQVGVDPNRDRRGWCWHALHGRSFRLIGQGWHAPIGTVDSTAMGPLARPYRVTPPDRWVPSGALRQLADRSTSRQLAGETSGQTSPGGHPTQIIAVRSLSTNSRPACGRPPAATVLGLKPGRPNLTKAVPISLRSEARLGAKSRTRCVKEKLTRVHICLGFDGIILRRYGKSMAACR